MGAGSRRKCSPASLVLSFITMFPWALLPPSPKERRRRRAQRTGRAVRFRQEGRQVKPVRVVIMGAGGRDFHNFNVVFRDDPRYEVVAFTAAQIPNLQGRVYPPPLA